MGGRRKAGRGKGDAGAQGRDRRRAGCRRDGPREAKKQGERGEYSGAKGHGR
ncbi:hypothetical protein L518_1388 [Bordetella bronchiseptica MBORD675]|nr:hypothetical protein L518_1388 [Bordetella bronchiseptica MBORD675]